MRTTESLRDRLQDLRNTVDFALRRTFSFALTVQAPLPADIHFQNEMRNFFSLYDWKTHLNDKPKDGQFKVLDVGARNFSLAPVFHSLFTKERFRPEVHGIEIDAYRRMRNFRTRYDYAKYFTSIVPDSCFHACDFLEWSGTADCVFALNPFVTTSPLLAWGLPLKNFRPEAFFEKAASVLPPALGLLFVTNPSEEEVEITRQHLKKDFALLEQHTWSSSRGGHKRFGGLYLRGSNSIDDK